MPNLALSKYMYETVAGNYNNQLPISSVCNAKCIFCSNEMNPFPIYRVGFRPLEDIRKGIALLNPGLGDEIRLGDSLPGRISEGEALLHPDILKVLKLIRDKLPHQVIQVSTNGITLTKDFIERLVPYRPFKFTIAYHSDNPENWCKILNLKEDKYRVARDSFFHLAKNGFIIEGAIVLLPNLVGYDDIENTLKTFRFYTKEAVVWAPGYSFKASKALKEILETDYTQLSQFIIQMRKKYRMNLCLQTDTLMPLNFFPYQAMQNSFKTQFKNVLWLFSEAAYEKSKKILKEWNDFVPNEHYALMVKNETYKGNIICAGLLMVEDYRKVIEKSLEDFRAHKIDIDLIILPTISFDRYGDDLQGENYSKLAGEFKLPVWLR